MATSMSLEVNNKLLTDKSTGTHGSLVISKVIFVVVIFVLSFLFAALPAKFRNTTSAVNRIVVQYGSCLSSGVFIGTCLLVLLPSVEKILKDSFTVNYPLTHLMVASGFLLTLFIEQITTVCMERMQCSNTQCDTVESALVDENMLVISNSESQTDGSDSLEYEEMGHLLKSIKQKKQKRHRPIVGIMLNVVLSFHGIFEGFMVGFFNDHVHVGQLYAAIVIHKLLVSLGLGFKLVREKFKLRQILICCLIFSAMLPLGAAIAVSINSSQALNDNTVSGIFVAIATGTFLFITFVDMLPNDLNSTKYGHRMINVCCVFLGFAIVAGITSFIV